MSEQEVVDRVEAFVRDFHAAWQRAGSMPMPAFSWGDEGVQVDPAAWAQEMTEPDFESWRRERVVLVERHFTPGSRFADDTHLSGKPEHDPAVERVVRVVVRRTRAEVETELPDGPTSAHHMFHLRLVDGGWRIDRIVRTFGPPRTPLLDPAQVARLLQSREPGTAGTPASDDLRHGIEGLFTSRDVVELGRISTSGVLTVHDLGWVRFDLAPFHRSIPAGTYPVEVTRDVEGTNLALRVRVADGEVVERVPAERVGTGAEVSVDAGNVAVLDFAAISSCAEVDAEALMQDWATGPGEDTVLSVAGGEPDAAVVRSGYGDGGYPAWWGLAADGSVVDLVVDFLVAVEDVTTTVRVPWGLGPVEHEDLTPFELVVRSGDDEVVVSHLESVDGRHLRSARVLAADGTAVPVQEGGSFHQAGRVERGWRPRGAVPADAVLEVVVWEGYRHT